MYMYMRLTLPSLIPQGHMDQCTDSVLPTTNITHTHTSIHEFLKCVFIQLVLLSKEGEERVRERALERKEEKEGMV